MIIYETLWQLKISSIFKFSVKAELLLNAIKKPKSIDLGLIGVLPEYAKKGVATILLKEIMDLMIEDNLEYAETNLNLENNISIINQWKNFDTIQHKRRRCFVMKIGE